MTDLPQPPSPFLEPPARELAEMTFPHPRSYELPPAKGRERLAMLQAGHGVGRPPVEETWVKVDSGRYGEVRTRIVRPQGADGDLPVVLFFHGGGWVFGDETTHDRLVRELATGAGAAVVFPVYERAPEARYPAQIEQGYAVAAWVAEHGRAYRLDAARVAVAGDSSGGNIAAALSLMAKERGGPRLRAQVLLYPVTDADFDTGSYRQFAEGYYLTRSGMEWFWDQYVPDRRQRAEPYATPLRARADLLTDLPAALVITGEADVLRDEGEAYAARLREAGGEVSAVRVLGTVHDFLMLDSLRATRAAAVARHLTVNVLRHAFR
ncbi:acetyl esterase [Streptomyces sp. DvalAA-14]|uniref:alpha/beta hydrolase n=1 Tax=unclassified Streptomyces TaxID=2593676 RepID=UPI00081AEE9C|nr:MULTISPECIES: alpha/beta hydrolase [unclassified Streptomyces]MYS21792.1 alpha/beta hydrolase fold domain-containing protein [Streptomyces sp. SID4948]SCE01319.1 acetyl esterase [Streptomyces sp. DvalAA-14]